MKIGGGQIEPFSPSKDMCNKYYKNFIRSKVKKAYINIILHLTISIDKLFITLISRKNFTLKRYHSYKVFHILIYNIYKYVLHIMQPSQYSCTQLKCIFAVIYEAPSSLYSSL